MLEISREITPSLEETRELARDYNLIALSRTVIADCDTPVSALLKLRETGPTFLLESAEHTAGLGRWSFVGYRPRDVLRWRLSDGGDPYAVLAEEMQRFKQAPIEGLPPFTGGAIGLFGYDCVRATESLPNVAPDDLGLPDMAFMFSDVVIAFDHFNHCATLIANVYVETGTDVEDAYARAVATIDEVEAQLRSQPRPLNASVGDVPDFQSNISQSDFEDQVRRVIGHVEAGDVFQTVISQRFSARTDLDPVDIYRALRIVNPSPYMYFIDFGDFQLIGTSPEPLVTVHDREVTTRPIAGTRPRGGNAADDHAAEVELLADEKERAEHIMLVDLARNDLGRVSEYGSVEVNEYMEIERYSHVMHIVSSVGGRLRSDLTATDALRAVLPAGTLSGAPKVRAMEIIDELESTKRGSYGGAVGYVAYSGELDMCICIRSVLMANGSAHIQAGAGIVADSDPRSEFNESCQKAGGPLAAVMFAAGLRQESEATSVDIHAPEAL